LVTTRTPLTLYDIEHERTAIGRHFIGRLARPRARNVRRTGLQVENPSSFGEDARGRVYVVSLSGPVYRLAAKR